MTELIGLIVGVETGRVYSVVNPDIDAELDQPHHLQLGTESGEAVRMVKIERAKFHQPDDETTPINCEGAMSAGDVYNLIVRWYITTSEIYHGPDRLKGAI